MPAHKVFDMMLLGTQQHHLVSVEKEMRLIFDK